MQYCNYCFIVRRKLIGSPTGEHSEDHYTEREKLIGRILIVYYWHIRKPIMTKYYKFIGFFKRSRKSANSDRGRLDRNRGIHRVLVDPRLPRDYRIIRDHGAYYEVATPDHGDRNQSNNNNTQNH